MAKRLNSRFVIPLVGLAATVTVLGVAGFALQKRATAGDPRKRILDGDAAMARGDAERTAAFYGSALAIEPDNTDFLVKYGSAVERLTAKDPQNLGKAVGAWNRAVSVDPRCTPALEKLLATYGDQLDLNPTPDLFVRLKVVCDRILNVHPDNLKAAERKQFAVINQWLVNQSPSNDEVRDSIDNVLPDLMKKDPDNGDLIRTLAQAKVQQARESLDINDLGRAHLILSETKKMIEAARKGREQNASVQFRSYQAWWAVRHTDPDARDKDREKEYNEKMGQCLDLAQAQAEKLDPANDPLCDDVIFTSAVWMAQRGRADDAEKMVRAFYEAHRDDQRARLEMARLLERKQDPKARQEAIEILGRAVKVPADLGGFRSLVQRDLEAQTAGELVRARMAEYAATPATDAAKRKQLNDQMDEGMDNLRRLCGSAQAEPVLELTGRLHQMRGEDVEAVKSFQEAAGPVNPNFTNYELLYQLALAYRRTGQPGLAKQRLEQILARVEDSVPARIQLSQIAIEAGDVAAAATQVKRLQELAPDGEDVKHLAGAVALMNNKGDPRKSREVFDGMSEKNRAERMSKAQVGIGVGATDEVVRLLQDVIKESPGDPEASILLARVYVGNLSQKETARRVIEDALKAHPEDVSLVVADSRLKDELPEVTHDRAVAAARKNPDPFVREMQSFELESGGGGHPEQAFNHLEAAHQARPDDVRVMDLMFTHYLSHGQFDKAGELVEKLATMDADKCGGLMYRYRLAWGRGDLAGAEALGRQLTRQYADFAASWLVLAQVLQAENKFDEARDDYNEVLKRQPHQYEAYQGLVEVFYKLDQIPQVKLTLEEARRYYPNDVRLREQALVFDVNNGQSMAAVPERERILKENQDKQKDTADDYLQLAKAYFHAAQDLAPVRPADAAGLLNKAFQTLAAGKDKFQQEARFYSQLAEMYQYNRHLDEGLKVLLEYFQRPEFQDDPQPALLLADFWVRAGRLDESERYLNIALVRADRRGDDKAIEIRLRLASLLAQEKKFAEAYSTIDGVPQAHGNDLVVVRQRIETQIAEGRRDEAKAALRKEVAVRDSPDLGDLLASLQIDDRDLAGALKTLAHVLSIDPRNDAAVYLQALAVAQQGQIEQGISQLLALRNRDSRNSRVRLLLAELYEKSGKLDAAIRELSEGLDRASTNKDLRLGLIRALRAQRPMPEQAWDTVIDLCRRAEVDPVLRTDPTWCREEALAWADRVPPNKINAVVKFNQAIQVAGTASLDLRREFVDLLLRFHDDAAVLNETDKLLKEGRNDWWVHFQRALALGGMGRKAEALAAFDKALDGTNKQVEAAQAEFILRGLSGSVGADEALKRVAPLAANDPDARWRLLQATLLRSKNDFDGADRIVTALLADPVGKPPGTRIPLLRAKADIWESRPAAEKLDRDRAVAAYVKARDAYVELLALSPEDMAVLNNVAYLLSEQIPPPEGGARKAKVYSAKAYDLARFQPVPNVMVLDTHGWVLTLCGGEDAPEGLKILDELITKRQDTLTFVEGHYHLGEAYLRAHNQTNARKYLQEAMDLIARQEQGGQKVDAALKDKVQTSLAQASGPVTNSN